MSEIVREMTYEEMSTNSIINILAIDVPFGIKRDLIAGILNLSYCHERGIKDALYTPIPQCTLNGKEGE